MNANTKSIIRTITDSLVDEMMSDVMIGYLFVSVDRTRLKQLEFEQAMQTLEHDEHVYTGRPLRQAHARHHIKPAQFDRRTTILKRLLKQSALGEGDQVRWLAHVEALREDIVQDPDLECNDP